MKTYLFVCTGNTCRSPMAAAIATRFATEVGLNIIVKSAGTRAVPNQPMTPEAVQALAEIEIPWEHHSVPLSDTILAEATDVLVMEQHHYDDIWERLQRLPGGESIRLSMVAGEKAVSDPLGQPIASYRSLALNLVRIIPPQLARGFGLRS